MSTFNVRNAGVVWRVDEYGLYYIKGDTLFVREHDTGKAQRLYTAESELYIYEDYNDETIHVRLVDRNSEQDNHSRLIDRRSGEVVWTGDELPAREYPVGDAVFSLVQRGDNIEGFYTDLYRNGELFLSEGTYHEFNIMYYGDNLLIQYIEVGSHLGDEGLKNLLVTPDGEVKTLRNGRFPTGTTDYLFFIDSYEPDHPRPVPLCAYDVKTGETIYLTSADVYHAVTDGVWFFTTAPWSDQTDCWRLVYDTDGKLTGLELWVADI